MSWKKALSCLQTISSIDMAWLVQRCIYKSGFSKDVDDTQVRSHLLRKTFFSLLYSRKDLLRRLYNLEFEACILPAPWELFLALCQSLQLMNQMVVLTLLHLFQLVGILIQKKPWTGNLALSWCHRYMSLDSEQCFQIVLPFITEWMPYFIKVQRGNVTFPRSHRKARAWDLTVDSIAFWALLLDATKRGIEKDPFANDQVLLLMCLIFLGVKVLIIAVSTIRADLLFPRWFFFLIIPRYAKKQIWELTLWNEEHTLIVFQKWWSANPSFTLSSLQLSFNIRETSHPSLRSILMIT